MFRFILRFCVWFTLVMVGESSPILAQFLTPEETVRLPVPAEVPVVPETSRPVSPPSPEVKPSPPPPSPSSVPPSPPPVVENDPYFADFAAYSREKNIILTWHLARGRSLERRIQIYRFTEEPKIIHDISRGTLIAKLSGEINLYEDVPPGKGTYYYAIFVESTRGLEPASFNIARNLVGPVAFQSESTSVPARASVPSAQEPPSQEYRRPRFASEEVRAEDQDDDEETLTVHESYQKERKRRGINGVIRSTFFRGDYSGAIRQLRPFLRNSSAKVRAKAMFYTGLSLYRLEQYERARQYFEHPLMKKFYRRNAEFWLNKITENSG